MLIRYFGIASDDDDKLNPGWKPLKESDDFLDSRWDEIEKLLTEKLNSLPDGFCFAVGPPIQVDFAMLAQHQVQDCRHKVFQILKGHPGGIWTVKGYLERYDLWDQFVALCEILGHKSHDIERARL
jgi:hypothetical protein